MSCCHLSAGLGTSHLRCCRRALRNLNTRRRSALLNASVREQSESFALDAGWTRKESMKLKMNEMNKPHGDIVPLCEYTGPVLNNYSTPARHVRKVAQFHNHPARHCLRVRVRAR